MRPKALILGLLLISGPVLAQTSASFTLEEHTLNSGGRPNDGVIPQSASFRITLDAIGDSVALLGMGSASFSMDAGFAVPYPPPEEVKALRFVDDETLVWNPEKSVGAYNLYRSPLTDLSGLGYGACAQLDLPDETATDADVPPQAAGFFYLVTAENLLAEEGTKGFDSAGAERANPAACP